jgi:hypothetical protein
MDFAAPRLSPHTKVPLESCRYSLELVYANLGRIGEASCAAVQELYAAHSPIDTLRRRECCDPTTMSRDLFRACQEDDLHHA